MRLIWKFCIYTTILSLCLVRAEKSSSTEEELNATTISPITTTTTPITTPQASASEETEAASPPTNASEPLPTLAAKLVRQRRQHPYTIVRHVVRSPKRGTKTRRRYKWPKYKYGPPNYNTGAPITYYKPTKQYLPELSDSPKYSPTNELDITNHFNSANYDFHHPSSHGQQYEDQTMDLDFYSHTPKVSHITAEYSSYDRKKEKVPTYSYSSSAKTAKGGSKPLSTYESPPKIHGGVTFSSSGGGVDSTYSFTQNEGANYDMHPMSSYDTPSSSHANKYYDFTSVDTSSQHSNLHIPATKYGVPDVSIPLLYTPPAKQGGYQPPKSSESGGDSYVVYEKKIPNAGYSSVKTSAQHNFAEPPGNTNVEITYSPAYEITLPASNHKPAGGSYHPPPTEDYHPPPTEDYHPPPAEDYHPPPAEDYHPAPTNGYHPTPGNFAEPPPPPPETSAPHPQPPPPPPPSPKYRSPKRPPLYKHRPAPPPYIPTYHPTETHAPPPPPHTPTYHEPEPERDPVPEPESHEPPSYENVDLQEPPSSYEIPDSHEPSPPSYHIADDSNASPPSFQVPHPPIEPPADSFEVPEEQSPPRYSSSHPPQESSEQSQEPIYVPHSEYPQPDYITPSKDLPINSNYMPPAYNYPKSSYEVPIYDPIPFDATSVEEHETFPPHNFDQQHIIDSHAGSASSPIPTADVPGTVQPNNHNNAATVTTSSSSTTTKGMRKIKKRKGIRNSTPTVTTKHILDTPELEEAYEASQGQKDHQLALNNDADVNESNHVEAKPSNVPPNYFLPTISPHDMGNDQQYISPAWNPVRIRAAGSTPTALPAAPAGKVRTPPPQSHQSTTTIIRSKGRRQQQAMRTTHRQQSAMGFTPSVHGATNTRQTTPLHSNQGEKVSIVSVDKSRSYSYYDGTSAPTQAKEDNAQRTRSNQGRHQHQQQQPTRAPAVTTSQRGSTRDQTSTLHRTTKGVLETTYFKSPHNDHDQLERQLAELVKNLPKNHKLF